MEPNIWGPSAWIFLHTVTLQYPEKPTDDDKKKYYVFFNSLKDILPCPNCKIHYSESITKKPIQLESRKELFEWLIDIHNEVNIRTGKQVYSYSDVDKIYKKMYNTGHSYKNQSLIILIVLLMIIGYYYVNNYSK